ncbi:hypothetical protein HZS_5858 [Henneguya salminicola]|uniref:M7GpppN-mRNA hydrolase (Trinotate prediction) n=1 Tax=Henneguya salminicola TaxID=69463 RepID=A0A6G3MGC5_HENSL|nr:hypothetical protein HZS_5858 [Henneguya salminicola]
MDRNTIIPLKIIDDLYIRFIFAAPTSEKSSLIRMMFRVELAHWFYWDYHCKKDIKLPKVKFRQFLEILINKHCFMPNFKSINDTLSQFREYKNKVPVYGLIMVSTDFEKVVLVQNYETRKWVFPKGKINESESPVDCAIREVIIFKFVDINNTFKIFDIFFISSK